MRRTRTVLTLLVVGFSSIALAQSPPPAPLGFAPGSRAGELEAEAKALAVPTPENARKWLRTLTAEPHVAGTPADYQTALFVRDRLQEWGWKTEIATYHVLLNYPSGKPMLNLVRPVSKLLTVDEAPLPTDKDSASGKAFGAFHGYGVSGIASGQVVYANYARPEDFQALEKLGVSVKDKIVLARYGGNFRGLKLLNAQKRGAAGILIYSDPGDDGYAKGDVYPAGPYRPGSGVQRGSVQFLSLGPGDPSTPNGPSTKDAPRLPISGDTGFPLDVSVKEWEANTGLKRHEYFAAIPSLPISYETAHEILRVLAGPNVPSGWQGGLPLAYHVGPGPAEMSLSVSMDYQVRPIWNVIATIPGTVEPDQWIVVGNHRDAWVYGAVDPGSGTAATLEMCRAIGEAVKKGWKPRRTIVYANWDAEEYGLVGSTEWAEEHAGTVGEKVALLLNVDSAVSGKKLSMSGVPSLRDLALDAAGAVTDARTGKSLRDLWLEAKHSAWAAASHLPLRDPLWDEDKASDDAPRPPRSPRFVPQLQPLGSGSDYTAFLDHLGVPSLDMGFSGSYGVYHSMYDNYTWMERFGDPEFLTHATAARLYTALVMRAAAAEVLPLRFTPYALALRDHVDELRLMHARQVRGKEPATSLAERPSRADAETFPGLESLIAAVRTFQSRAEDVDHALGEVAGRDRVAQDALSRINGLLVRVERAFLLPKGLPGRPWFKHAVYAPGVTTGYGAWPLPAIREAIENHKSETMGPMVAQTVDALNAVTAELGKVLDSARGAVTTVVRAR